MLSGKDRLLKTCLCVVSLALTACYGCGKRTEDKVTADKNKVVARVGDEVVTVDEYIEELAALPPRQQEMIRQHRNEFLNSLIERHLLLREAKRKNLERDENVLRYLKRAKEELMIQQLIEDEISQKAKVTNNEIESHYRDHGSEYAQPPRFKASHIVVQEEGLAKKLMKEIQDGADFARLAREYSFDTPTKYKGGDLGYFSKDEFLPEIAEACERLDKGALSIVKTRMGYHVLKVVDKKETQTRPLEDVQDYIREKLLLNKQLKLYDKLIENLKERNDVSVNQDVLNKIILPPPR